MFLYSPEPQQAFQRTDHVFFKCHQLIIFKAHNTNIDLALTVYVIILFTVLVLILFSHVGIWLMGSCKVHLSHHNYYAYIYHSFVSA